MELNNVDNFKHWDKWKKTLARAVNISESIGLSDKTIENFAYKIGNILSANVDPENREHRLLKELWTLSDESERHVLSKLIVKMVQNTNLH
ncbi:MAG: DUF3243 domain-containing protein [Clostridia bacterium]|nr:DUF3243 domain-containing protein [Clostridia bacterium]